MNFLTKIFKVNKAVNVGHSKIYEKYVLGLPYKLRYILEVLTN